MSEIFSVELKFTIDTLNSWFSNTIKPKFLELDELKKQILVKENPIAASETICYICGFLLDTEACGKQEMVRFYSRKRTFIYKEYL